ncbi:hypothetical protein PQX77_020975 [Marasmius sp. AFHP31]|nr:hypothetical protein PQX77_020975 [Marasmius sp. AFHP31]
MASSVLSEHAFSSSGITITKRRNCLHGDVVEALQVLKVALKHDYSLLTPESLSLELEEEMEADAREEEGMMAKVKAKEDNIILELDLDCEEDS